MSFYKRLSSGEFAVLVEMNTPKGVDIAEFVTNARRIKGRVNAVVVPDMDNGVMRMSALAGGALVQQQGLEAIMHVYCRDRNRMALQGDLLAAHVLGIQNLIVVRGEEMANADHCDAKAVDDLDELGLFGAIHSLQRGVDMAGFELNGRPHFTVGCAMRAGADGAAIESEVQRGRKAVEAGAQYVITPPIYDVNHSVSFLNRVRDLGVPIIATVFLLKSVGIARYIAQNEPGAHISEELIRRMRQAPDRDLECVHIAGETVASLKPLVQGVLIVTLGWEHRLPVILDHAGL
jgi:methylenetetrahydrofolate reductase (NADPH)